MDALATASFWRLFFLFHLVRVLSGEFSNSTEMPSFEAELILQIGGRGHVSFGHSYSFAAGYVYILMAALAGICLAQLCDVKRAERPSP
jgi:hypothetical protein